MHLYSHWTTAWNSFPPDCSGIPSIQFFNYWTFLVRWRVSFGWIEHNLFHTNHSRSTGLPLISNIKQILPYSIEGTNFQTFIWGIRQISKCVDFHNPPNLHITAVEQETSSCHLFCQLHLNCFPSSKDELSLAVVQLCSYCKVVVMNKRNNLGHLTNKNKP